MQTSNSWHDYNIAALKEIKDKKVPGFNHHIYLVAGLEPGLIAWNDRKEESFKARTTVLSLEDLLKNIFTEGNFNLLSIESPLIQEFGIKPGYPLANPSNPCEIYSATLVVKDNGLTCAGLSLDLCFNRGHRRNTDSNHLQEYPLTQLSVSGLIALPDYEEKVKQFLTEIWDKIHLLDYSRKSGPNFDSSFLIEVLDGNPISGGKHLLTKLGLSLSEKDVYLPC